MSAFSDLSLPLKLTVFNMLESAAAGHHMQDHRAGWVLACPPSMTARCSSWSEDDSQLICYKFAL